MTWRSTRADNVDYELERYQESLGHVSLRRSLRKERRKWLLACHLTHSAIRTSRTLIRPYPWQFVRTHPPSTKTTISSSDRTIFVLFRPLCKAISVAANERRWFLRAPWFRSLPKGFTRSLVAKMSVLASSSRV
jgi:hypothetical protein